MDSHRMLAFESWMGNWKIEKKEVASFLHLVPLPKFGVVKPADIGEGYIVGDIERATNRHHVSCIHHL